MKKSANHMDPGNIAKGAAVVSIAAGAVAAGVILSNKKNRQKAGKMAAKGMKVAKEFAEEIEDKTQDKYQDIAKNIPGKDSEANSKKRK